MKNIAIITGATGGLGKEFVALLYKEDVDEIWAIARNREKLDNLKVSLGDKIVAISADMSKPMDIEAIKDRLEAEKPMVKYLINNAGVGKMGDYNDFTPEEVNNMIDLNCKSVAMMCTYVIPYVSEGSHILNISSQASFQPDPYLNLYAASKAFVTSYSRGLNRELKKIGVSVTAVCPGWVNTELLIKEWNGHKIKFPGIVEAAPVARKAMVDARKCKDMSVYSGYVKYMQLFSKLMPHKVVMNYWVRSIEKLN